jgi:chaperonin GroEL (HSP60 family)
VQLTRGMDKTVTALVQELKDLSTEVADDKDLANVAAVSAGGHISKLCAVCVWRPFEGRAGGAGFGGGG